MGGLLLAWVLIYGEIMKTEGLTYQECMNNTERGICVHPNPTTFCASNGVKYNGTCEFSKALCAASYLHHTTIKINGTGSNGVCHPLHINVHTTSITPITATERKLFNAIATGIDSRLLTANHSHIKSDDAIHIFSKQDHSSKTYIRNPHCWAHDLDITCISPWNSQGKTRKAGTLISPRHAVWARHYSIRVNSTLRFVDKHNNVVDRTIIKTHALPTPAHARFLYGYDMVIGLLDSDVPQTISYAKVLPKNFTTLFGRHMYHKLPVMSTDFEEKVLVDDLGYIRDKMIGLSPPTSNLRHQYYESKIVGDSGNPSFFIIDDSLVFLFVFTYGGAGSGTSIQYHHDDVNKIMTSLGGGYKLTEIDLSKYASNTEITHIFG